MFSEVLPLGYFMVTSSKKLRTETMDFNGNMFRPLVKPLNTVG